MKFRLVDSILNYEPKKRIRGTKAVSFEEYQLKRAFGDHPALPESLVLGSLFQLCNWLTMLSSDFTQAGLVLQTERIDFHSQLRPGERLKLEIQVQDYQSDHIQFDGQAHCGSRAVATGAGCTARPVAIDQYYSPADMHVWFSEIYRPHGTIAG